MKKTLHILFFSALSVAGFAQHKAAIKNAEVPKAIESQNAEIIQRIDGNTHQLSAPSANRDLIFHETFDNGFLGTTEFGSWTHSFTTTGVPGTEGDMWSIQGPSFDSPYDEGTTLASATPDKFAVWDGASWADIYDPNFQEDFYTGFLNAPEMDFTDYGSVVIEFQHRFRYCCYPSSPITVDVSSDGGATWSSFNAIGTASEGANIGSANPLTTAIDISCAAAGQESVLIRFAYNSAEEAGYTHYYWAIDEVKMYENESEHDLFIDAVTNGDIMQDWEYRVTPAEQIRGEADGGVIVGVRAGNRGNVDEDATVTFRFLKGGVEKHVFVTESIHFYSATNDTVCPHVESSWYLWESNFVIPQDDLGLYTLEATIRAESDAETEEAFENNVFSKTIVFSDNGEYGHDPDTSDGFPNQIGCRYVTGNAGNRAPGGWGANYTFVNPGSKAHGVTVRFGSNTVTGVEFKAALIKQTDATLTDSPTVASGDYETTGWLADNYNEPLYFAFNEDFPVGGVYPAKPYSVETGNGVDGPVYAAVIWRQNASPGQISVLAEPTEDYDNSSIQWEKGGDQAYHWFYFQEYNYAVRLILSADSHIPIAVDELENNASFTVYPNPAVNEARVAFDLVESGFIAYEVRDIQGRLMDTANIGRFGAGQNSFSLNVSDYPAGNYIVGLVIDGQKMLTQQISVIK